MPSDVRYETELGQRRTQTDQPPFLLLEGRLSLTHRSCLQYLPNENKGTKTAEEQTTAAEFWKPESDG